jgi:hypothetical protein
MPYMKLNTTRKLSQEQKKDLVKGLGEAVRFIPGKLSEGLLLYIEDDKTMFLGANQQDDYVFVNTEYCGHYEYEDKNKFTVAVFAAIQRVLGTPNDRMSMKLTENDSWCNFGDYIDTDADGKPLPR